MGAIDYTIEKPFQNELTFWIDGLSPGKEYFFAVSFSKITQIVQDRQAISIRYLKGSGSSAVRTVQYGNKNFLWTVFFSFLSFFQSLRIAAVQKRCKITLNDLVVIYRHKL